MNAAFSTGNTTIEGRIILTAENRTGPGFAAALRDLNQYVKQAQQASTTILQIQSQQLQNLQQQLKQHQLQGQNNKQQIRQNQQVQQQIQRTGGMMENMFRDMAAGAAAAFSGMSLLATNWATQFREQARHDINMRRRLAQVSSIPYEGAGGLKALADAVTKRVHMPDWRSVREFLPYASRGTTDQRAIERRLQSLTDIRAVHPGLDVGQLEGLESARNPAAQARIASRFITQADPGRYQFEWQRQKEQGLLEREFSRSQTHGTSMLYDIINQIAASPEISGAQAEMNKNQKDANDLARNSADNQEALGKTTNEWLESIWGVMNEFHLSFKGIFDKLTPGEQKAVTGGAVLLGGYLAKKAWDMASGIARSIFGRGGGGGAGVPGGPRVPRLRLPFLPRLLPGAAMAAELFDIFSDPDPLSRVKEYLPDKSTLDAAKQATAAAQADRARRERERLGWGGRPLDRTNGGRIPGVGDLRSGSGSAVRVRPPSNIPGFLLPGYGSALEGDPLSQGVTIGSYSGTGVGSVEAARPIGSPDPNLSSFTVNVDRASRSARLFSEALMVATMTLYGTASRGRRRGGGRGGGTGAGGATGGTAGVGAPGGYPSMAPGGVGMSGGLNTGGGTGFGQYGAPGSEWLGGGGAIGGGGAAVTPGQEGVLLDAIARAEGTYDSGYDTVLGYGRYGTPPKPLTQMTLDEVYKWGQEVLRPNSGMNSSAVGRYQFVGGTMMDRARELGISGNTLFSPEVQDRLAIRNAEVQGLGAWEGFKHNAQQLGIARGAMGGGSAVAMPGHGGGWGGGTYTGPTPMGGFVSEQQSRLAGIRRQALDPQLRNVLEMAGQQTGLRAEVFSGGQAGHGEGGPRTGSTRHDHGLAADLKLYDVVTGRMLDMRHPADAARMEQYGAVAVQHGATGIGAGQGYMGPNSMHIGFGKEATWGGAPWIGRAAATGRANRGLRPQAGAGAPGGAPSVASTGPTGQLSGAPPFSTGKAVKSHPALPLHSGPTPARLPRARNGYTGQPPIPVPKGGAAGGSTALSGKAIARVPTARPPHSPALLEDRATREMAAFGGNLPRARPDIPGALAPATTGSVIRGGIVSGGGLTNVTRNMDRSAMDFAGGGMDLLGGLIGGGGRNPLEGLMQMPSLQLGRGAVDITVKLAKQLQAAVPSVLPASHFDLGINVDRTGTSFSRPGDPAFPPTLSP